MHPPSFKMAIIKTMNGEKSNFHMRAINMKPNCTKTEELSICVVAFNVKSHCSKSPVSTYHYTNCNRDCIDLPKREPKRKKKRKKEIKVSYLK